jgi:hypothetical protein
MNGKITKEITIDVTETIDVDVTLRIEEIIQFFEGCNAKEKAQIKEALKITVSDVLGESLLDSLKMELCRQAMEKYTLEELETKLK